MAAAAALGLALLAFPFFFFFLGGSYFSSLFSFISNSFLCETEGASVCIRDGCWRGNYHTDLKSQVTYFVQTFLFMIICLRANVITYSS